MPTMRWTVRTGFLVVLLGAAVLIAGCASKSGAGSAPPSGTAPSSSASPSPSVTLPTTTGGNTVVPPHIICSNGSRDYSFDGSQRPIEICIHRSSVITVTVTIPAGQHWDAPQVSDPGLITASNAEVSGSTARVTLHPVETGGTTLTISSAGKIVWQLRIAVSS